MDEERQNLTSEEKEVLIKKLIKEKKQKDPNSPEIKNLQNQKTQNLFRIRSIDIKKSQKDDKKNKKKFPVDSDYKIGSQHFMKYCSLCHSLGNDITNLNSAPLLNNIYGRISGIQNNFRYSENFKNAIFRWNKDRLFQFLKDKTVDQFDLKGSRCKFDKDVSRDFVRADIVAFLKKNSIENELNTLYKDRHPVLGDKDKTDI